MKIYVISPPNYIPSFNASNFDKISDLLEIEHFQFRPKFKKLKDRILYISKYYEEISKICKKKKITLIINNDFEIAKKYRFDGIHLGQNDKSCLDAKHTFGEKFIVGISCGNSLIKYNDAKNQGADYVAFGPFFKTNNKKKHLVNHIDFKKIRNNVELPLVLIGGVNHKNFSQLKQFLPSNIAIIDALWNFSLGPLKSAELFKKKFNN